jgi:hypothetical protein
VKQKLLERGWMSRSDPKRTSAQSSGAHIREIAMDSKQIFVFFCDRARRPFSLGELRESGGYVIRKGKQKRKQNRSQQANRGKDKHCQAPRDSLSASRSGATKDRFLVCPNQRALRGLKARLS